MPFVTMYKVSKDLAEAMLYLGADGHPIHAIKLLRHFDRTLGLKDAKDIFDALRAGKWYRKDVCADDYYVDLSL